MILTGKKLKTVYVIVHHYDRGSDEVRLEGAYRTKKEALAAFKKKFPSYKPGPETVEDFGCEYTPDQWWYYADPEDTDCCDRAQIETVTLK